MKEARNKVKAWCKNCFTKKTSIAIGIGLLLLFLFPIYFWHPLFAPQNPRIASDIKNLAQLFYQIDHDVNILDFALDKTPINFLNVKSFTGSTIGSMVVKYPEKWQGPYLEQSPMIQDTSYYILKNVRGYYIIPGNGIKLDGGKVVGRDILLTPYTDIETLLKHEHDLTYNGQPLITKLELPPRKELITRLEAEAFGTYIEE